jgi:hypothetical protein
LARLRLLRPESASEKKVSREAYPSAPEIEICVERIEARLKTEMPEVTRLFVKPQTSGTWARRLKAIEAASGQAPD